MWGRRRSKFRDQDHPRRTRGRTLKLSSRLVHFWVQGILQSAKKKQLVHVQWASGGPNRRRGWPSSPGPITREWVLDVETGPGAFPVRLGILTAVAHGIGPGPKIHIEDQTPEPVAHIHKGLRPGVVAEGKFAKSIKGVRYHYSQSQPKKLLRLDNPNVLSQPKRVASAQRLWIAEWLVDQILPSALRRPAIE